MIASTAAMLRHVLRLLLLFAVFHHGVALPGTWQVGVANEQAAQHAVMHWQGQQHHHHDDGGVHDHAGKQSAQHLTIDSISQTAALMAELPGPAAPHARQLPSAPLADAEPANADLERFDRPPRAAR